MGLQSRQPRPLTDRPPAQLSLPPRGILYVVVDMQTDCAHITRKKAKACRARERPWRVAAGRAIWQPERENVRREQNKRAARFPSFPFAFTSFGMGGLFCARRTNYSDGGKVRSGDSKVYLFTQLSHWPSGRNRFMVSGQLRLRTGRVSRNATLPVP